MKISAASAALALLPALSLADAVEKRGLQCSTVYGPGEAKVAGNAKLATQTKTVGGKTVRRTVKTKHTVYVTPTVSRTLTGVTVQTDRVTKTNTGKPTTVTVTGSSTSTVAAQPGFTAASAAVPKSNTNAKATNANAKANAKSSSAKVAPTSKHTTVHHATHHAKASHAKHHTKRDADAAANGHVPLSVVCTKSAAGVVTLTATEAQKPYATKYAKAITHTINHQKTKHVEKVVATTTIHRKETVELPRATHWAACDADNLLGWTWGRGGSGSGIGSNSTLHGNGTSSGQVGISSVVLVSGTNAHAYDTSTATQCCIKCQLTPGCVGSQWRSGVCNIHVRPAQFGACSRNQAIFTLGSFFANPLSFLDPDEGYILSNGRCGGTWKFGGLTI